MLFVGFNSRNRCFRDDDDDDDDDLYILIEMIGNLK